jgi:hypothetical protein
MVQKVITKKALGKLKYLLLVVFSLWFIILPVYQHIFALDDFEWTSCILLESCDQENATSGSETNGTILALTFSVEHPPVHCSLVRLRNVVYQIPSSLDSNSLVLRC